MISRKPWRGSTISPRHGPMAWTAAGCSSCRRAGDLKNSPRRRHGSNQSATPAASISRIATTSSGSATHAGLSSRKTRHRGDKIASCWMHVQVKNSHPRVTMCTHGRGRAPRTPKRASGASAEHAHHRLRRGRRAAEASGACSGSPTGGVSRHHRPTSPAQVRGRAGRRREPSRRLLPPRAGRPETRG